MLTKLQTRIMKLLAANRSESSYVAGGVALNADWPRISDDVDIFHDTDEEIGLSAEKDIQTLRAASLSVATDISIYGLVEATVSFANEATILQWMSESRTRFFPLVRDKFWGARLHFADLAINKVIAASSRSKARDMVDLALIAERYCPLGPLLLAAAGKPPNFSPLRMVEEIRRRANSMAVEDLETVRGMPEHWNAPLIRQRVAAALEQAEAYLLKAPPELTGVLALHDGKPIELDVLDKAGVHFRRATAEPEVMPVLPDTPSNWRDA